MFNNWKANARTSFLQRNLPALPIEKFSLYGGGENAKKILYGGPTGTGILMDLSLLIFRFALLMT